MCSDVQAGVAEGGEACAQAHRVGLRDIWVELLQLLVERIGHMIKPRGHGVVVLGLVLR